MVRKLIHTATSFGFIILLITGCSGGGISGSPAAPALTENNSRDAVSTNQYLWGFWEISLDTTSGVFEIVPVREAVFQANVTQFLQPPSSPINLLEILIDEGASNLLEGYVVCEVTARHPFPGLAQYRGFDVLGIVMGDGSIPGESGDGELRAGLDDMRLLNADGHARWWNPTEFTSYESIFGYTQGKMAPPQLMTATVNPFKYFADGLDAESDLSALDLANRGTFGTIPGFNTREYELQFPMEGGVPQFVFNYAVTASYYDPFTNDDSDYPIESFSLSANCAEAFRISPTDNGSTAYYESPSSFGGNLEIDIEVFDWGLGPTTVATEEISAITLESPTLFTGQVYVDLGLESPGTASCSRVFPVSIPDVTPSAVESQEILVRVLSTSPNTYAPDIPGITGFDFPEDAPLAAFYLWEAVIGTTAVSSAPDVGVVDGPTPILEGESWTYTLSYANDPEDGTDLTILWDNDGDLDFDDDLDGDDTNLEALLEFYTDGTFEVIARAVDSSMLSTDSLPFEVVVLPCPDEIHNSFSQYWLSGVPGSTLLRMDSGFQTVGAYAGEFIVAMNSNTIGRYDSTGSSPWSGSPYISVQNANSSTIIFSIDICDYSGRVITVGRYIPATAGTFYVYDSNGSFLTSITIGSGRRIGAIDTDDNGDLWISTCQYNGYSSPDDTYLQHYEYQATSPYYVEDPTDVFDTTAQVDHHSNIWDIAISYSSDRIYLFHGNYGNVDSYGDRISPYGEIYSYDMASDGSLTLNTDVQNLQVFPSQVVGAYMDYHSACTYGKIDIDHVDENRDGCRIVVMARRYGASGTILGVMDSNLTLADYSIIPHIGSSYYSCSIGVDPDPSNRQIVATGYTPGWLVKSEAPLGW